MTVTVCMAEPIGRDADPVATTIAICERIPAADRSLAEAEDFYRGEAKKLYGALTASLPQGTLHALLVELLNGAPSLFRGPAPRRET
ncbi:MAG: hypothetical protein HOW73_47885 [Polyangiaceae bacterium]|nr:hypothetical protein [Polyangiaceae bacterium]